MRISDWSSDVCSSDLQPGQDHARARAARHVDRLIAAQRALIAVLLHVRPGVAVVHDGSEGEIIVRRGRTGRPFQGAAVPGIAGRIAKLVALREHRKSVVEVEIVSGRVDRGGRLLMKTKKITT